MTEKEGKEVKLDAIKSVSDTYGPYAFGVVSLLTIWFLVVGPEIERNAIRFDEMREIVKHQQQISSQMHDIVRDSQTLANTIRDVARMIAQNRSQADD